MACARAAIVSSKVGCAPDLIEDGVTGWTFDPGPAAEQKVATILEHLYANRHFLQEVGVQARKRVRSYSFDAVAGGIKAALESISKKKQGVVQ
jgi:glycosyltransferase involved in cell wall biosynthesis